MEYDSQLRILGFGKSEWHNSGGPNKYWGLGKKSKKICGGDTFIGHSRVRNETS